jgi:hypothetical protein
MQNGVYRVLFKGLSSEGRGILVVKDGYLWGGDSAYVYDGKYTMEGANGRGGFEIKRDDPNSVSDLPDFTVSVFGNLPELTLYLVFAITPPGFTATGQILGPGNLRIEAIGTKLADI